MNTPPPIDDIPEARREVLLSSSSEPSRRYRWLWLWVLIGLVGAGFGVMQWVWPLATANESVRALEDRAAETISSTTAEPAAPSSFNSTSLNSDSQAVNNADTLLGHRRYLETDSSTLVPLQPNGTVLLKSAAAEKAKAMIAQARQDGVKLGVISGFRTYEDQKYLFFDVKAERGETPQTRADVSAPPGYSEHHTGYAVDFTDLTQPQTALEESFDQTPAFQWLQQNAAFYGFELSFPQGNAQALSYEPWHWRFVGDQESLETFYRPEQ